MQLWQTAQLQPALQSPDAPIRDCLCRLSSMQHLPSFFARSSVLSLLELHLPMVTLEWLRMEKLGGVKEGCSSCSASVTLAVPHAVQQLPGDPSCKGHFLSWRGSGASLQAVDTRNATLQAWQVGMGLGRAKARRLYQSLAHWKGRSLRALWGTWRSSIQETTQNLARAEAHWLAKYRFAGSPCDAFKLVRLWNLT